MRSRVMPDRNTHSGHRLKAEMVALEGLNLVISCKAPIAIHNKCDVLWYWALLQGADEKIVGLLEYPFCWG